MKQIIEGKLYDTEKSKKIYSDCFRIIYKTNNGNYFLLNKLIPFEISPLTEHQVRRFIECYIDISHDAYELYVKEFGEPEEA